MLRGGAVLHDQSTDPAAGMPASASGGPGARLDSRLLGGFNTRPFIFNESVSSSSTEEVLAQSNPLTNNVCSFVIPGQNSPGVFWDLSKTTLEIAFSDPGSAAAESFFCKYMTSTLFFDKLSMQINGVAVTAPAPIAANNRREVSAGYYGYLPEVGGDRYAIPLNEEHAVRDHHYFAMGDNSANSFDSRGWGEVPEGDVVGQPLFILHPFTSHWGPAK